MSIQWFPGHMNAAKREAAEQMENIDVVVEVLDARLPEASCNPLVEEIRKFRQRPCLKVLNKIDLADPAATAAWKAYYDAQEGVTAYPMTTKKPADVARIPGLCLGLAPHRGVPTKPLRIMIMGIPNVGKSTLMNALLKKRVAKVGDEPAVTRRGGAPRLPRARRRVRLREGVAHAAAGLPQRRAGPHQPGDAGNPRGQPGAARGRDGREGAHRRREGGREGGAGGAREAGDLRQTFRKSSRGAGKRRCTGCGKSRSQGTAVGLGQRPGRRVEESALELTCKPANGIEL